MKLTRALLSTITISLTATAILWAVDERSAVLVPGPVWKRHTIDNSSRGADGVKLGDINLDGLQDVVTGWEEGGEVRVYLNPGSAKSRDNWPRVIVAEVGSPEDAIFADLDSDGRLDVVSCTEGKARTVFWHRSTGDLIDARSWSSVPFPSTVKAQMWMQAAAMDVDGELGTDLLLASKGKGGGIGWLRAPKTPGDSSAWTYHLLREAGWVMSLSPQDMDEDGDLDIFFSDRKGPRCGVFWLENPGANGNREHTAWKEHSVGALGQEVMFCDLADVNGDGLLDVAVAVKPADVMLFLKQPSGGWDDQVIHLNATALGDAKAVKVADVNSDNLMDLFFTCENAKGELEGIIWLEQREHGTWQQHTLGGPEGVKYDLMQVFDIDGDGDVDVLTCEERDQLGVIWYENPLGGRRQ